MIEFAQPYWFLLVALIPLLIVYERKNRVHLVFPQVERLKRVPAPRVQFLALLPLILRVGVLVTIITALARPQFGRSQSQRSSEGLDIMLVIDTSKSMTQQDFRVGAHRVDRLKAVKSVLEDFVGKRIDDRLGLVVFGSQAFAQVPLTLDHDVLLQYIDAAEIAMAGPSTAIGDAIGVAVNRMKELESKDKIVILLTDGANQAGQLDPMQAANAAQALGVKVYTIGIGAKGDTQIQTLFGPQRIPSDLDENLLTEIAKTTNARYFHAADTEKLKEVYDEIDQLEKTKVKVESFHIYEEKFAPLVILALFLLFAEVLLGMTSYRKVPL